LILYEKSNWNKPLACELLHLMMKYLAYLELYWGNTNYLFWSQVETGYNGIMDFYLKYYITEILFTAQPQARVWLELRPASVISKWL